MSLHDSSAGSGALLPPDAAYGSAAGLSLTAAEILAGRAGSRRGRRVLVGGAEAAPVARQLCRILSGPVRCIWLDLTSAGGEGGGLAAVLDGAVPLSRAILSREGGIDRLNAGAGHPDTLIERPHGLAIVLDALSFAYEVVVMSAPERDESLLAEVLAAVSDDAVLAGSADPETGRAEVLGYAARGAGRAGILAEDGRATWLAGDGLAVPC